LATPYSPTVNYDVRSAHFTGVKFGITSVPSWHWDDTKAEGEHWLYFDGQVVAIVAQVAEDDFRIPYPHTYPVQDASSLDGARKKAIEVALWALPSQWPLRPTRTKPPVDDTEQQAANDLADAKYVAEDEMRWAP
jgi:hypothetical protein